MVSTKSRLRAAALLAGIAAHTPPAMAEAGDVILRLKNSGVEFAGTLRSFDGLKYVVEARSFGLLSLDADRFDCEGERCASAAKRIESAAATVTFIADEAESADRFTIRGSDTLGRELMPALIRDYAKSFGGSVRQLVGADPNAIQFKVTDARGSMVSVIDVARANPSAAFTSLSNGSAAIAMSSRPIAAVEAASLSKSSPNSSITDHEHVVALDGMAVIVSPESRAVTLGIDKLAQIFSGTITNWSAVGLPAGPIKLYAGSENAGSTDAFNDVVLRPGRLTIASTATRMASEAEISDAVARDPNGIGVTSYAFLRNAKPVGLSSSCGLTWQASEFAIKAEEYPLSRRLYLYTAAAAGSSGAERLVKFANSGQAQNTIAASQFMDQSVVSAPFEEQGTRASAWLQNAEAGDFEKGLARNLLAEIKDARRLSLTFRFALASSELDAKARQDLTRLVDLLQTPEFKGKTVMLMGFTDTIGTPERNSALAIRRATEVREAILAAAPAGAVNSKLLVVDGYGAVAPVACNDGAEAMNRNRRVEVWVRDRLPEPRIAVATPPPDPPIRRKKKRPR